MTDRLAFQQTRRRLVTLTVAIMIGGCASHSMLFFDSVDSAEVPSLISKSPHIKSLTKVQHTKRTDPQNIVLFNYAFHEFNAPNRVLNWQYHYMIGPASAPDWSNEKIAEVIVYLRTRDDATALQTFKRVASDIGGDAVVEMHRKPIIPKIPPAPIEAYLYYGVVVRMS